MTTAILGTGSYLPETVLTSAELGKRLGVGEQWIYDKTRITERRVAAPEEATSDLATRAAQSALEAAGLTAADVDLLIVATSTPDQPIPATACAVQANLGAVRAAAFDVDSVCTGFIYALVTAHAMITADPLPRNALVIGADTYSRILNYRDRHTCVLFGDGAGAVVLGKRGNGRGWLASTLSSDGTQAELVRIPDGGSRRPITAQSIAEGQHYFTMYGRQVRELAARVLPDLMADVAKSADLTLPEIDLIVPHQANGMMLKDLAEALDLRPGQMHLTVGRYGNTGAASVPITLDDAVRAGRVEEDDAVLLVAFGGGMSWGGAALRWAPRRRAGGLR
ncbi:3-oxoacyl-ACP synthase III family protein [Amycolatopsis sp. YIM 10]|uniref:3-oxoacyl-ACP synthase III family protein n=1 Tax=Amycolatopsis sp. YIM 10 TaxID=2653857 RepID=UPI0012906958|nr:beta-ketoacyl-ACP synthase III [Amycolatopsis sp. YIM 10]QFU91731.1 Acetoacetyl CoA synthase NphT7 [Amycolatopsis sp. YIM 10]